MRSLFLNVRILLSLLFPVLLWAAFLALTVYFPRVVTTLTKDANGNVDAGYETKVVFGFTVESGTSSSVSGVDYNRQTWTGSFEADPPFEVELEDSGHARLIQEWLEDDSNRMPYRVVSHRLFIVEVLIFGLAVIMTCFAITNAAAGIQAGKAKRSQVIAGHSEETPAKWKELFADEYFTQVFVSEELISVQRKLPLAALISIVVLFGIACGLFGNFFMRVLFIPGLIIGLMVVAGLIHKMGYMSQFRMELANCQLRWKRMLGWQFLSFDEIEEFYCDSVASKGEPGFAASILVKTRTGECHSLYETLSAKKDMQSARRHFEMFTSELNDRLIDASQDRSL